MNLEKKSSSSSSVVTYKLKNYEDLFYVHGDYLSLRDNVTFDRESCEAYELFVNDFRILVKILDLNDNVPIFFETNHENNLDRNGNQFIFN